MFCAICLFCTSAYFGIPCRVVNVLLRRYANEVLFTSGNLLVIFSTAPAFCRWFSRLFAKSLVIVVVPWILFVCFKMLLLLLIVVVITVLEIDSGGKNSNDSFCENPILCGNRFKTNSIIITIERNAGTDRWHTLPP
jgi:hypothetical protein